MLILHAPPSEAFPREREGGGQIDRQMIKLPCSLPSSPFCVCLHDSVSAQHLSHGQTDLLIQPSRRRLFSRSIFICATCDSALPWVPYPFPLRSLGNRTFKAAHLKAGPTQHSLMGPWEVAHEDRPLVTGREGNNIVGACWGLGIS